MNQTPDNSPPENRDRLVARGRELILAKRPGFAGRWLLRPVSGPYGGNRFLSLIVGVVLLACLSTVPYLAPIVDWLAILFALGALVLWMFWKRLAQPTSAEKPQLAER